MQLRTLIASTSLMLFMYGCEVATSSSTLSQSSGLEKVLQSEVLQANTAILWVKGIGCPGCIPNVEGPLTKLAGVDGVSVDLPTGKVSVSLTSINPATREELVSAMNDTGFTLDRIEMPQ